LFFIVRLSTVVNWFVAGRVPVAEQANPFFRTEIVALKTVFEKSRSETFEPYYMAD
jgi:hypothetical protein